MIPEIVDGPPQPVPAINFQVAPDGALFIFNLGNGLSIQQAVDADAMQQICKLWLESRKQLMAQKQLVADVMRTKAR